MSKMHFTKSYLVSNDLSVLDTALLSGGDSRITVNSSTLKNSYGARPCPCDNEISFSSSTANTISQRGYAAAAAAFEQSFRCGQVEQANDDIRQALRVELGLDNTDIVLTPSGTDSALLALAIARMRLGCPICSIVVGADESGSGVRYATSGRHFGSTTSAGVTVVREGPLAGLEAQFVSVALRDHVGEERPIAQVDNEVEAEVAAAFKTKRGVALFVMDHSKLGSRGPSDQCIDELSRKFGGAFQLIVDACQARLSAARIRFYLKCGGLVLITGSKFWSGPALSGAVLVPFHIAAYLQDNNRLPPALAAYTARSDWPSSWAAVRHQLMHRAQLGQTLRWFAAVEEMRTYNTIPMAIRRMAIADFGRAFDRAISGYPELRPLPPPRWIGMESDEEFSGRTIFPFWVIHCGRRLSLHEAKKLHWALNSDLSELLGAKIGATICHLGQPVQLQDGSALLRISVSARLVSDGWANEDPYPSENWLIDQFGNVTLVFEKLRALVLVLNQLVIP